MAWELVRELVVQLARALARRSHARLRAPTRRTALARALARRSHARTRAAGARPCTWLACTMTRLVFVLFWRRHRNVRSAAAIFFLFERIS
jgi:hypothetical protein